MQNSQENNFYPPRRPNEIRTANRTPKKNVYKTYNTILHTFGYEHAQKQKNTFVEVYCEKSTPSDISKQEISENNTDVYKVIPAIRELLALAECMSDEYITKDQYLNILIKLKIWHACAGMHEPPKYFEFQKHDNKIRMEDFIAFFTLDVQNMDFAKYSKEEIVLKVGLEIFRAVSKESISLDIRHLVGYMKEHRKLDIDMTSMLEIFDFFMDPDQGVLKTQTSLISFFSKNASKLYKALTPEFIRQMQFRNQNKKGEENVGVRREGIELEQENKTSNIIKIYDSNARSNSKNRPSQANVSLHDNREANHARTIEKAPKIAHINLDERNILDMDNQFFYNMGISEVFQEILPKNRGWLMRKSNRYENKWSMVFFEIKDNKLTSTKPTSLKKSINVKTLEIHKCNILEVIKHLDPSYHPDLRKSHKRTPSQSRNAKKENRQSIAKVGKDKPDYLFFIVDKATQKTYLIKSPDNMIIGSIIHFYILKDNPNRPEELGFMTEPEYSGVIEIAVCKKKCISKYHSSLKSYSFKKQFLVIKHGKFNIYEMKIKDNIDLLEYETRINNQHSIVPQPNQYIFSLERVQNYIIPHDHASKAPTQSNLVSIQENGSFPSGGIKTNLHSSPKSNIDQSFGIPSPNYEELRVIEYKNTASKGFFSNILRRINSVRQKDSKIILACDTELKRRQWILTLKFFAQIAQQNFYKSSFSKDSGVSAADDPHSFQTEFNPTLTDNNGDQRNRNRKKKQSSISFKHKAADNSDFIDVYKADDKDKDNAKDCIERITPREIESRPTNYKRSLPLMTEPDASQHLDSEELLMTFQQFNPDGFPFIMTKNNTLGNKIIENFEAEKLLFSNEITSMSDVEIWQRFLTFFIQEKHHCSEFDLNSADSIIEDSNAIISDDIDLGEDVSIRSVIVSDFNIKKYP